ncbi:hypothetical protein GWK47_002454 [Chionoecetes opilio]|uniref:Uncharacterized protein n=1 Tax=Chionoecetes opilio TaxID=41210 RepID=A0A8J4XNJ8_CHIOP|nr:hypothetical protein GWK47_002454 [Chionoecetes opilio]
MAAIWVAFGTGKNFMYWISMPYAMLWEKIGQRHCLCSTVSRLRHNFRFLRQREEISMGGLECLRGGDGGLQQLHESPLHDCDSELQAIPVARALTVIIYNKTSNLDSVNEARRESSHRRTGQWKRFPNARSPSAAHTARSLPSWNLGNSDQCEQKPPTPEGFGWTLESATKTWRPVWSNLPVASQACSELVKCGCKSATCGDDAHARRRSGSAPNYAAANVNSLAEK